MVRVTLTGATPAGSQRIKADANTVEILIQENDMPGGIFEFGPAMPASFRVEVGHVITSLTVEIKYVKHNHFSPCPRQYINVGLLRIMVNSTSSILNSFPTYYTLNIKKNSFKK